MAIVDFESVVADLEAHVRSKNSHGQRELLELLADLRAKYRQPEGFAEKVGRVYLPDLIQALGQLPADERSVLLEVMEEDPPHRGSESSEGGSQNGNRSTAVA